MQDQGQGRAQPGQGLSWQGEGRNVPAKNISIALTVPYLNGSNIRF